MKNLTSFKKTAIALGVLGVLFLPKMAKAHEYATAYIPQPLFAVGHVTVYGYTPQPVVYRPHPVHYPVRAVEYRVRDTHWQNNHWQKHGHQRHGAQCHRGRE